MTVLTRVLWAVSIALAAALVAKLFYTRLFQVYSWFTGFLCFDILRSLVLLPVRETSVTYAWIFLFTQPVTWLLYILVVLELYAVALRGRPGIVTLSRWALSAGLMVSVAVSALTLWADLMHPPGRYPILIYYSVIERGLIFSLAVFVLLITAFLTWFPIPVTRNIRLHTATYSVFFLSSTMALFVQNVTGYSPGSGIDAIIMLIAVVCFALWLGGLSRRGEELAGARASWEPAHEQQLMQHLDALNAALLRRPRQ